MASNPTGRLSAAAALPRVLSHSASFPIRAPLSSDDNGSDADTLASAADEEDDGFETASDFDKASFSPPRVAGMPVAHLTTADDDGVSEEEVFEDGLSEGEGFQGHARVPSIDQVAIFAGGSEVSDGEVYDPSTEGSEDGILPGDVDGVEESGENDEEMLGGLVNGATDSKPVERESDTAEMEEDELLGGSVIEGDPLGLETVETELDSVEGKIDGDTIMSGSSRDLEGREESDNAEMEEDELIGGRSGESTGSVIEGDALGLETVEAELDTVEGKIDGDTIMSGSRRDLEGREESHTAEMEGDELTGGGSGESTGSVIEGDAPVLESVEAELDTGKLDGETVMWRVESDAAEMEEDELLGVGSGEATGSGIEGVVPGLQTSEAKSDTIEVKIDGDANVSGFSGDLKGREESNHVEAGADTVKVEIAGVAEGADSDQKCEPLSPSDAGTIKLDSSKSIFCAEGSDYSEGLCEGSDGSEAIESLDGGSASVDREIAEDFADRVDAVPEIEGTNGTDYLVQETAVQAAATESEQALTDLEAEPSVVLPELVAVGGDSVSVQEAESHLVLAEDSESRETEREITTASSMAKAGNSAEVSGETLTLKPVADVSHAPNVCNHGQIDPSAAEEGEDSVSEGPKRAAILESSETKQIVEELDEGSSSTSTNSGFGSSLNQSQKIDGLIASDSDEDAMDSDEEGEGKELFDSTALAALLKAVTGASSDGSISVASPESKRIFSVDRPAGLGSSIPSLKPAPARLVQPNLRASADLGVASEPENNMDVEERKLHDKVELLRVKYLQLVQRLGHSPEESVPSQVLYRMSLAEGIQRGRQASRVFSHENARKKALELEMNGKDNLDFSCTILVLGKSGVGKSATVNSIFGEEKSRTNAFEKATTSVKEIVGIVDGVKVRVIDTPGLRTSMVDHASNRRILSSVKKHIKRCPPDIVIYVDRVDTQTRDVNDLPLLRSINTALGSSIWLNAIVALTHASTAPPDGSNGCPLNYDLFVAQRSHLVQHTIRQAVGDMRLMNPVALVENHPSCRRNGKGERVLPNGLSWRPQMLLLCYSTKILSETNSLLKIQEPSPRKLFGFRLRSPPLAHFLSSLLQSRPHPKLTADQGGENDDTDVDLDYLLCAEKEEEEDEYDDLPPFKPLRKSQIAKLTKAQKKAYFDEYDYRVKLLQKKQWKEELIRVKERKKRGKSSQDDFGYGDMAEDIDQDNVPATVPVPLPDRVLPDSFDSDDPSYRYRSLEPTSGLLVMPVVQPQGWDHDCGYDMFNLEHNLAVVGQFPAGVFIQVKKDKKEFNFQLDSSISAKHGENVSTLSGLDIQSIGKQLAYTLRSEAKFKNLKKNKTGAGISITCLGETIATGLKIEDQLSIGKRVSLAASTGAVRAQGDVVYGTNLVASLRDKDYPFGQSLSTLVLSLLSWRGNLDLGANLESQIPVGRSSKMTVRVGLNSKMSGQITVRTSSSEHLQIALAGILPIAISIYRSIWPGESIVY